MAWPAIGPDVAGLADDIPAKLRYEGRPCPNTAVEVASPAPLVNGHALFTVYNIRGQAVRIFKGEYDGRFFQMERELPNGLYVWVVRQGKAVHSIRRVVVE